MASPLTGRFPATTDVCLEVLCLQQQDGFVAEWLPEVAFRQQLLVSFELEPQPVPLQQQDDSLVVELKQNLLIVPSGQRQS